MSEKIILEVEGVEGDEAVVEWCGWVLASGATAEEEEAGGGRGGMGGESSSREQGVSFIISGCASEAPGTAAAGVFVVMLTAAGVVAA